MNVTTETTTRIELSKEEAKTLWDAYCVIYDLALTMEKEHSEKLIGSHYKEFTYDELENTYHMIAYLFDTADGNTFKVI